MEMEEVQEVCADCEVVAEETVGTDKEVKVVIVKEKDKSNTFSLIGLILALVGFFMGGSIFQIGGIVCGAIGIAKAKSCEGKGKGMGIAAVITGVASFILTIVSVVLAVVVYIIFMIFYVILMLYFNDALPH
jgi:hypothetical protein